MISITISTLTVFSSCAMALVANANASSLAVGA
jgi:hypothetical protein